MTLPSPRPLALAFALIAAALGAAPGRAATCPRPGTLGVEREMPIAVGPAGLFVGTKSYPETLPLGDHEIVLTFDDGPAGKTTDAVLAALQAECVHATFFVVGRMAAAHPDQLRRMAAAGHTIGHHSMTHPIMTGIPFERGRADIVAGWSTVDRILGGPAGGRPASPGFRARGAAIRRPSARRTRCASDPPEGRPPNVAKRLQNQSAGKMFEACGPFGPCCTSNETRWFSSSER